jgi:uncharacterized damage-inducible protein DinB
MSMTDLDEQGRPEPPNDADEVDAALGFLEFQRATLRWKVTGADAQARDARVGVSTMTLGGIVKHLTWVEDDWFSRRLHGNAPAAVWAGVDWDADPDWEWTSAADDATDELLAVWESAGDASRRLVTRAMTGSTSSPPSRGPTAAPPTSDGSCST